MSTNGSIPHSCITLISTLLASKRGRVEFVKASPIKEEWIVKIYLIHHTAEAID